MQIATEQAVAMPGAFPPAQKRIGSVRFGWRLGWGMLQEQPRLYLSCMLASLVVAVAEIAFWSHTGGDFIHQTNGMRLLLFIANILHRLAVLPAGHAAFRRMYFGNKEDVWLWQSPCWREPRFSALFLGILICEMLPGSITGTITANGWFSDMAGIAVFVISILGLAVYFFATKAQFQAPALIIKDKQNDLRTALQRSQGHFWDLALGSFCVIVPLIILVLASCLLLGQPVTWLAAAGYLPLLSPFNYWPVYSYALWGLLGPHVFIAQMAVISAFYTYRPSLADLF